MKPEIVSLYDDRNRISHWHPIIENETDIPAPETEFHDLIPDEEVERVFDKFDSEEITSIIDSFGGDAFTRGEYKSASTAGRLNLNRIRENDGDVEEVVKLELGKLLTDNRIHHWSSGGRIAIREYLDLHHCEYFADPLHPEARFFIRDGEVVYWYPRMDKSMFEAKGMGKLYEKAVDRLNRHEKEMTEYAEEAAEAFDGRWSIDFVLTTERELYCTDMALDAIRWCPFRERWLDVSGHEPGSEYSWMNQYGDQLQTPENETAERGEGPAPYSHTFEEIHTEPKV